MYLIILGALPPPRGGVTTHVERLLPYLENAGIDFVVFDHSKIRKKNKKIILLRWEPLKAMSKLFQPVVRVLHYPLSNISLGKLIFLLCLKITGIRLTITLVASPAQTINNSDLKLLYMLTLTRFTSHIVTANRDFKTLLVDNGIPENKISIIPAFIPIGNMAPERQDIPQAVVDFCIKSRPLIITYAYGPDFHNREDLYGLDLIVELAEALRKDFSELGFIVVIPEITNENYFDKIRNSIRERGLDPLFCFAIGNQFSFVSFLQYADLFIRATNTDGDALTLREANYYGVPSIASDVCCRPENTTLFQNRSIPDLCRVVRNTLVGEKKCRNEMEHRQVNNADLFISIFEKAAGVRD